MANSTAQANAEHSESGFPPIPRPKQDLHAATSSPPSSDVHHSQTASPDSQTSPGRRPRPSSIWNRICFGRAKDVKELAVEDLEKRRQAQKVVGKAQKDVASRERKARRDREERTREGSRKASKESAKQNKEDKAQRRAKRRLEDYYGIRGYDPNAGMLRSGHERVVRPEDDETRQASEETRELPGREMQIWGLEFGTPKHHKSRGHFSGHHENCGEQYGSRAAADGR